MDSGREKHSTCQPSYSGHEHAIVEGRVPPGRRFRRLCGSLSEGHADTPFTG